MQLRTFLILIIGISSSYVHCQEKLDTTRMEIHKLALENRFPNFGKKTNTLLIAERPTYSYSTSPPSLAYLKQEYEALEDETFFNFMELRNNDVHLDLQSYHNLDIAIRRKDDTSSFDQLMEKFPGWDGGYIEISSVGINTKQTQAMLYISVDYGTGAGGGCYLIFEKLRRHWKVKKLIMSWTR